MTIPQQEADAVRPLRKGGGARLVVWAVALAAGALFVAIVLVYFFAHLKESRAQIANELTNVADLKIAQIAAWRKERLGDGRTLMGLPRMAENLKRISQTGGDPVVASLFETFFENFRTTYGYDSVHFFDRSLKPLMARPAGAAISVEERDLLFRNVERTRDATFQDLYRGPDGSIHLDIVVPIWTPEGGEFCGAVVVRIDPERQLYPLVRQWPKPSETAETVLVRRDGDTILFLIDLRHYRDAALSLRIPLDRKDYLVSKVLVEGGAALREGLDYRGEPVLAVVRQVPDSPWVMIAKVAQSEAYEPIRIEIVRVTVFSGLIMVIAGLSAGAVWRRHRRRVEAANWLAERQSKATLERMGFMLKHANDGIFLLDETLKIVEANERAAGLYGYANEELLGMRLETLHASGEAAWTFSKFASERGHLFEAKHRRKDGFIFPVEVSARPAVVEGGRYILAIVRDIRERKAHEWEIERLGRLYLVISRINQAMLHKNTQKELFDEVCRILVENGRFRFAWVGLHDPETRLIKPDAVAGHDSGYVAGLVVSSDPNVPEGRGPSGVAYRENRTLVCNDYLSDPLTSPWKENAAKVGVRSAIALPLRRQGKAIGQLAVYAEEKNCFGVQEITLLEETVENISFALGVFEAEVQRREAETALRRSETRLQFVLTTTPAVIYSFRADGVPKVLFISGNVYYVLGYEPKNFLEDPGFWAKNLHPDDLQQTMKDLIGLSELGLVVREYRFKHADGTYRWMYDEMRLVRDEKGNPQEFVGYWFDNTARKEAEEALKEREEIFSTIVGQAVDAIMLIDVGTGRFAEFNTSAHENLGYTREEFAKFTIADVAADEQEISYFRDVGRLRREGGITFEARHRHKGGWVRDVRMSARVIAIRGKDYVATVWVDITESKRLVLENQEQARRLAALMGNLPGMAYRCKYDPNWTMEFVSAGSLALTGYLPEELVGNKRIAYGNLIYSEDRKVVWERVTQAIEVRNQFQLNYRITTQEGAERWLWERGVGVYDEQGKLIAVEGFVMDVTERQQFEIELHELVKELRALHVVSTAVDQHSVGLKDLLKTVVTQLPRAMKRPDAAQAEIELRGHTMSAGVVGPRNTEMTTPVTVNGLNAGRITVGYVGEAWSLSEQEREMVDGIARTLGVGIGQRESFETVRRSEERFRAIFDHADVGMFETTTEGRITRANAFLGTLLGMPKEELPGRHWTEFMVSGEFGLGASTPPSTPKEVRCLRQGRREFWGIFHGTRETDDAGQPKGYICLLQDISVQVEARDTLVRFNSELEEKVYQRTAELAARNREVQALLQAIPDMVMLMESDGTVVHFQNVKGGGGLAALAATENLETTKRLPAELEAPCMQGGRSALKENRTVISEAKVHGRTEEVFIEMRAAPMGANSFVVFVRDITDRKRLEAETAAMLEKERQVSEMKTRFISVTSHEFRTPMAAALGSAELLKNHMDRLQPEKRTELIRRIETSMHRMTEMLDDILLLSRMDAKRTEVKLSEVDLGKLVHSVVEEVQLGDFNAHLIDCEVGKGVSVWVTDPILFHHILSNLLGNAVRYSQAGMPVKVQLAETESGVRVVVEDKGIGIPVEDRERVFEPFERGSNVGTIKGTGIGLNIVKRMTDLIGGIVKIEEVEGGGTRFVLLLPRLSKAPE